MMKLQTVKWISAKMWKCEFGRERDDTLTRTIFFKHTRFITQLFDLLNFTLKRQIYANEEMIIQVVRINATNTTRRMHDIYDC